MEFLLAEGGWQFSSISTRSSDLFPMLLLRVQLTYKNKFLKGPSGLKQEREVLFCKVHRWLVHWAIKVILIFSDWNQVEALHTTPYVIINWRCQGLNLEPSACKADPLPPNHVSSHGQLNVDNTTCRICSFSGRRLLVLKEGSLLPPKEHT